MTTTTIEWCDRVWNVVTGCDKISLGCANCYAEGIAKRFWGDRKFSDVQFHEDRLRQPLSWKKLHKVFVNSMSDLFHEDVTDEQLDQVFAVMALAKNQIFQILTKRPQRMLAYFQRPDLSLHWASEANWIRWDDRKRKHVIELPSMKIPLPNVWLGVTTENQKMADERIPLLLQTPAAIRFLSCEPLLGELQIEEYLRGIDYAPDSLGHQETSLGINWVIVGGESGNKARSCHIKWVRSIVEQCQAAEVPVFVKQLGAKPVATEAELPYPISDRKGGVISDFPSYLQVREFPAVS